jgi:hypothetical protein
MYFLQRDSHFGKLHICFTAIPDPPQGLHSLSSHFSPRPLTYLAYVRSYWSINLIRHPFKPAARKQSLAPTLQLCSSHV